MKTSGKIIVLAVTLSLISQITMSQNESPRVDQAELLKKFEGTWICDIGKDTIAQWDMIPWGSGFEARLKYTSLGKIVKEGKGLYGYDKSLDKIVEAGITKGKDIAVYVMWFTSVSKWVLIPYCDLPFPEKTGFKMEGEFRSPDNLVETNFENNRIVKVKSWTKAK
jgi:hypothetical protein